MVSSEKDTLLLSHKWKIPGYILLAAGTITAFLYSAISFRFELPVFAVVSSYMETRFFTTFSTNFADELAMLLLLSGCFLLVMSQERKETDAVREARRKAAVYTVIINSAVFGFSILFLYGSAFMAVVIANLYLPFLIYLVVFGMLRRRVN